MNRIVIVALAAVLSHFTLACAAEPSAPSQDESAAETADATLDEDDAIDTMPADEIVDPHATPPAFSAGGGSEGLAAPYVATPAVALEKDLADRHVVTPTSKVEKDLVDPNAFDRFDDAAIAPSFEEGLVIAPK